MCNYFNQSPCNSTKNILSTGQYFSMNSYRHVQGHALTQGFRVVGRAPLYESKNISDCGSEF